MILNLGVDFIVLKIGEGRKREIGLLILYFFFMWLW